MKNNDNSQGLEAVLNIDSNLRKIIAEYYISLKQMNDPVGL